MLLQISLSVRPHGINQYSFLVYLLGLHNRFTVTFGTSLLCVNLSAYYAFVPSFCPSGYDFAIPSSRLHLTMQTLGVAFGLVGNYLPADFHRRALICPSYTKMTEDLLDSQSFLHMDPELRLVCVSCGNLFAGFGFATNHFSKTKAPSSIVSTTKEFSETGSDRPSGCSKV